MTGIPAKEVTNEDLVKWWNLKADLARVKAQEMLMRLKIFKGLFPTPHEGTNNVPWPDGATISVQHKIERKVDEAILKVLTPDLRAKGINVDKLIRYKPELVITEYRTLTAEEQQLFDQVLDVKPGSPQLEIKPAKAK